MIHVSSGGFRIQRDVVEPKTAHPQALYLELDSEIPHRKLIIFKLFLKI